MKKRKKKRPAPVVRPEGRKSPLKKAPAAVDVAAIIEAQRPKLLEPARGTPEELRARINIQNWRLGLLSYQMIAPVVVKALLDAYEATVNQLEEAKMHLAEFAAGFRNGIQVSECTLPPPPKETGSSGVTFGTPGGSGS